MNSSQLSAVDEASGQYWKDLSGKGFDAAFVEDFSYADAMVRVVYQGSFQKRFSGRVEAKGLKPNSCYQVNLEGKPWEFWAYASDDVANEALGRAGRFWRAQPDPAEVTVEEYEASKDTRGHVYIGSILIDFFVTDESGDASVEIGTDRFYNMIWNSAQRAPQPGDGPIRAFTVNGSSEAIYGEALPGYESEGSFELPSGAYDVQLSLTEESFGDPDGSWARVMVAQDVTFEIE